MPDIVTQPCHLHSHPREPHDQIKNKTNKNKKPKVLIKFSTLCWATSMVILGHTGLLVRHAWRSFCLQHLVSESVMYLTYFATNTFSVLPKQMETPHLRSKSRVLGKGKCQRAEIAKSKAGWPWGKGAEKSTHHSFLKQSAHCYP